MSKGEPYFIPYIVTEEDAEQIINKLANFSFYTLEEELKKGYITIPGGHRVGLAGKVILENGLVKAIRNLASFNFRIAREKIGVANPYIPVLYRNRWRHTMIIGAPQSGKKNHPLTRYCKNYLNRRYEKKDSPIKSWK